MDKMYEYEVCARDQYSLSCRGRHVAARRGTSRHAQRGPARGVVAGAGEEVDGGGEVRQSSKGNGGTKSHLRPLLRLAMRARGARCTEGRGGGWRGRVVVHESHHPITPSELGARLNGLGLKPRNIDAKKGKQSILVRFTALVILAKKTC